MNLDDHTYRLIDQYLQGELSEDHPFVQRLKDDKELTLEVEVQKAISGAVVDYRLMSVEKLIASKRNKFIAESSLKWKWAFWSLPVLLAGVLAFIYVSKSKQERNNTTEKAIVKEVVLVPKKIEKAALKSTSVKTSVTERKEVTKSQESISARKEPKTVSAAASDVISSDLIESKHSEIVAPLPEKILETPSKHEAVAMAVNPCLGVRIKAYVEEARPCSGTSEGQLKIKEARGGKAPYHFSLDGKHFQETNMFVGLKSNEYNIILKDANGCLDMVYEKYPLKSKNCVQFLEHVFNPNVTTWEVPNNLEKSGELAVFDRSGQRIYFRPFDKAEKLNWGGTHNSGEILLPGIYIYSIKYSDGVVDQGRITITY